MTTAEKRVLARSGPTRRRTELDSVDVTRVGCATSESGLRHLLTTLCDPRVVDEKMNNLTTFWNHLAKYSQGVVLQHASGIPATGKESTV